MTNIEALPVAVIGAGPVGLAAAAHLLERGETPLVFESGSSAGETVRAWSHVRMFSPWEYNVDAASHRLLLSSGWTEPDPEHLPTGGEIFRDYLEPLATRTELRDHIKYDARVLAISRVGVDKIRTDERGAHPFLVRIVDASGVVREHLAKSVIDASGTWTTPNPMGANGLHPLGEEAVRDSIDYGIPDIKGARREFFQNVSTLVVGSGHSAFNLVLDLVSLKTDATVTEIFWAMRKQSLEKVFGGGSADALPARGALGQRAREAVENGAVTLFTPFSIQKLARTPDGRIEVSGELPDGARTLVVDRIVVATGFRPDLHFLREMRLELDPSLESARALGPLIDPNEHSCGSVRPHGARELAHPEPGFYIAGMKSYGRAPTFLLATGYEQVRSIVAELVGDHEGAARVELNLPETGVCSLSDKPSAEKSSCCDENEPASSEGCCGPKKVEASAGCCG